MEMGFAVPVSGSWATGEVAAPNQRRVAQRAEELGYTSVWTFQRLLYATEGPGVPWAPVYRSVLDPVVTLAHLAGVTSRVRLGVAVLNAPFFSPALLGKQLATLDVLSGGRLDAGLGLGWSPQEFAASNVPIERRGARGEDFIAALKAVWGPDPVSHRGEFYEVPPAEVLPKPLQRPHPPILVGGFAEAALRRAGRVADGWVSGSTADLTTIGGSIAVVRAAAEEAGRDPAALRFVVRGVVRLREGGAAERRPLSGSVEEVRGDLALLAEQGVTEVFVDLNFDEEVGSVDADPARSMDRAEECLEAFRP